MHEVSVAFSEFGEGLVIMSVGVIVSDSDFQVGLVVCASVESDGTVRR